MVAVAGPATDGPAQSLRRLPQIPRCLRRDSLFSDVIPERKSTWYNGYAFGEIYDLVRDPREKGDPEEIIWNMPPRRVACLVHILEKPEPLENRAPLDDYAGITISHDPVSACSIL